MKLRTLIGFLLVLILAGLLLVYLIFPSGVEFSWEPRNSNFSIIGNENMQFYPNMRFPESSISYKIYNCPLQKKNDIELGFSILENKTLLKFYPADLNEELSVMCENSERFEGGLFIAGEGGPTAITQTEKFNIILGGKVLLLKDSDCSQPNIAIHEVLHVLGFEHSNNKNNIMYNISKCGQTIGDDALQLINNLYAVPSYSDLMFQNASASMDGRYLDLNITVRNDGLAKSKDAKIKIYADNEEIKEIDFSSLEMGYGRTITITSLLVLQINIEELRIVINADFEELDKTNNQIVLKIKKTL